MISYNEHFNCFGLIKNASSCSIPNAYNNIFVYIIHVYSWKSTLIYVAYENNDIALVLNTHTILEIIFVKYLFSTMYNKKESTQKC